MSHAIIINGTILTANADNEWFHQGAVAFEDGVITYVGYTPEDLSLYDEVIDAKGDYVLPGLVNTHGHTPMSLLRGYADDLSLQRWLEEKIWPLEAQFTAEHVKWGTYLSIAEMLRTGTTTFVDMYDHIEDVADAVKTSGIRARLSPVMTGFGTEEHRQRKLQEAGDFANKWKDEADGKITTMLSPHAPYTCSPDYLEQIAGKAAELQVPVHIHMSETQYEVDQHVAEYGMRPAHHLQKLGLFNLPVLVAHAVHVNDAEIDVLADQDVKISHNIISNLKLGSGTAPVPNMLEKGLTVSLGTDSVASNNNLDLFEELRQVALLYKGIYEDPTLISAEQALRMATIEGGDAVWLKDKVGSLETGKEADLILMDSGQTFYQPQSNPISHVAYSASGRDVKDVFVQGKQVVKNHECLTIDEERVMYETNRMFKQLNR